MTFISTEGRFNNNTFLIDGNHFGGKGNLALYVIENNGNRLMVDITTEIATRKVVLALKELKLYPIHKIVLTHSHWDHIAGIYKLKKLMKETEIEVLASENAIENLKNPEIFNKAYGEKVRSIEGVMPLKEGDIIDLNGLKLEVLNFFGHTMDSIAVFDKKNKSILVGDAIINRSNYETVKPPFMPPDFNEEELLKTYQRLRDMKEKLSSISLAHYGVWTDDDFENILKEMQEIHFKTKESITYNEF